MSALGAWRFRRQDAVEQVADAETLRPETQPIAIQAVALNARDGLNVAPLTLGLLATATKPLEFSQERVLGGVDVQYTGRRLYPLSLQQPFGLERIVSGDEEVHLDGAGEVDGIE